MTQNDSASFFKDAHHLQFHDSSFTAIVHGYSGIESLSKSIASGAIHNSAARQDPPKCHRLTRTDLLADILDWIKDPAREKIILWLNGPAGAGKSAILQTLAEACEAQKLLAASFFFSRAATPAEHCATGERFFATIAYELAVVISQLRDHVDGAMRSDPTLATKSMERQMLKLIVEPMRALLKTHRHAELRLPPVIIVDSIDECMDEKQQAKILRILLDAATSGDSFPFCVVISSRAEFGLDNLFASPTSQRVTKTVCLDDQKHVKAAQGDIRAYLRVEFDRIRNDPVHGMGVGKFASQTWPSDYILNFLTHKSLGQFVHASTIIDFVGNPDCSPDDQLRLILALFAGKSSPVHTPTASGSPSHEAAFVRLDSLYSDILAKCPNRTRTLDVLGHLLAMTVVTDAYCATWGFPLNTGVVLHVIDYFLRLGSGDSERAIRRLQPLISLAKLKNPSAAVGYTPAPMPGQNIRKKSVDEQIASLAQAVLKFSHSSFSDFLQKRDRAGHYTINLSEVHAQVTLSCLRVMSSFNPESATREEYLVLVYAVLFWTHHCTAIKGTQERAEVIKHLRQFDVVSSWILPQTLPVPSFSKSRLQHALETFGLQDLKDCPGQSRWSSGNLDLQSMLKELTSVSAWLNLRGNADPTCAEIAKSYDAAFAAAYLHHLEQSPSLEDTLFVLGILKSGEVSEHMLLDLPFVRSRGLDAILHSTQVFLYRYKVPVGRCPEPQSPPCYRVGFKSLSFSRFLGSKHLSRRILSPSVYHDITLSLLALVECPMANQWDPTEYSQAWTYSLLRAKNPTAELLDNLAFATKIYSSSSYLQNGLRRHHAKRVLAWLNMKRPMNQAEASIASQWSSPPIWKRQWHLDERRSPEAFPAPTLYELAIVTPAGSIWNDSY